MRLAQLNLKRLQVAATICYNKRLQIVPLNINLAPEIVRIRGCNVESHNDWVDLCSVRVLS